MVFLFCFDLTQGVGAFGIGIMLFVIAVHGGIVRSSRSRSRSSYHSFKQEALGSSNLGPVHPDAGQAARAAPDAVAHPDGNLPPAQPLVDEPHAHHELLPVQRAAARAVDQVPDLGELIGREAGAPPNVPDHDVGHALALVARRGRGAIVAGHGCRRRAGRRGSGGAQEVASVGSPDCFVALALALADLVAPLFARPLVVLVFPAPEFVFVVHLHPVVILRVGSGRRLTQRLLQTGRPLPGRQGRCGCGPCVVGGEEG